MWTIESVGEEIMRVNFILILLYSGDWTLVSGKQFNSPAEAACVMAQ